MVDTQHPDLVETYALKRRLRETCFGIVHLGHVKATDLPVAVKQSYLARIREGRGVENPKREIELLQYLQREGHHPHVIQLLDTAEDSASYWTVLEFCNGCVGVSGSVP